MAFNRLDNLLKKDAGGTLEKIIQRAQNMDVLTTALKRVLEPGAADNLLAANVREDGELVLVCASSAWASRIRFEADAMMDAARKAGLTVTGCRVSVSQSS